MNRGIKALTVVLCLALLAGCTPIVAPDAGPVARGEPVEPQAGQWQTWIVPSLDDVRPAAPPDAAATQAELAQLKEMAAALDDDARAQVAYWNAGSPSYRWINLAIAEHAVAGVNPSPRYGRGLAMLNVAIYDAMVAAWESKYAHNRPRPSEADPTIIPLVDVPNSPSYPSEQAVAAGAASTILSSLFPDRAEMYATMAEEAGRSRLLAGVNYLSDVEAGMALGRAVAEQVLARAATDGFDAVWDGVMPTEPGHWTGENPVQPMSGTWKPWVLESGDAVRPPPPPAYDSEQMQIELTALKAITPTLANTAAAYFWQTPPGGMGYNFNTAHRLIFENGLDTNPPQTARIYAAMSVALADAFIACYDAKYAYWSPRPFQVDPEFKSLFPSPNFPSYPSAHSCQTTAWTKVLGSFFPADAEAMFATAETTKNSRLWAGIHFQSDLDAGELIGDAVAAMVLERDAEMVPP